MTWVIKHTSYAICSSLLQLCTIISLLQSGYVTIILFGVSFRHHNTSAKCSGSAGRDLLHNHPPSATARVTLLWENRGRGAYLADEFNSVTNENVSCHCRHEKCVVRSRVSSAYIFQLLWFNLLVWVLVVFEIKPIDWFFLITQKGQGSSFQFIKNRRSFSII